MQAPLSDLLRVGVPRSWCSSPRSPSSGEVSGHAPGGGPERLSKTLARRRAERDDALNRAATTESEGLGADRASQLLGRMRRSFRLEGSDLAARG